MENMICYPVLVKMVMAKRVERPKSMVDSFNHRKIPDYYNLHSTLYDRTANS